MMYVFAVVLPALILFLPSPHDKDGWGLRVHNFSVRGPYLQGEGLARMQFDVTLLNFSTETREHDPLPVARDTGDLGLSITPPDGKRFRRVGFVDSVPRDPFTQPIRLRAGEFSSVNFNFMKFGYALCVFAQVGRHRVEASIKIDGKTVKAPPVEFEVVAVPPGAVLVSHAVALEGRAVKEGGRPVIQQVPLGNRTLLIYRCHYEPAEVGGGPYCTRRLAELPGKCEMTVEGAYGAGNPLTVTYRIGPGAKPTRLVVNSIGGSPWTAEEEQLRQERLRAKNGLPPLAPPPRPTKP